MAQNDGGLTQIKSPRCGKLIVQKVKNQTAFKNKHHPLQSRWFAKRSRAAGVLLFGWLFFLIAGIVQPCCTAFADFHNDGHTMSQSMSAGEDTNLAGAAGSTGLGNDQCPWAFTADTAPLPELPLLPATADHTSQLVVVSHAVPLLAVPEFSNSFDLYPSSPPPPRFYVRSQRLLI